MTALKRRSTVEEGSLGGRPTCRSPKLLDASPPGSSSVREVLGPGPRTQLRSRRVCRRDKSVLQDAWWRFLLEGV